MSCREVTHDGAVHCVGRREEGTSFVSKRPVIFYLGELGRPGVDAAFAKYKPDRLEEIFGCAPAVIAVGL